MDTNQRADNEEWLFNALVELEELSLLGDFCRHAGIDTPTAQRPLAETVWPAVRKHYQTESGQFDVSAACRKLLAFAPFAAIVADKFKHNLGS